MSQTFPDSNKKLTQKLMAYLPVLLAAVLWCILTFKEYYYLKKVEDLSIFLFDKLLILESFKIPGGFLGLAGSFLTQFLHLPWLGALIWVMLLLLTYYLTITVFRIPENLRPLAIIPVALLVIGNMSLGYGVFIMREQDHFFAPLLGYLAALIPISATGRINGLWGKILFLSVWIISGFILLGTFAFTGALAAACAILVREGLIRRERITLFALTAVMIAVVPLVIYPLYTSYRMADSWILGLPSISEDVWTRPMRTPLQLALLYQILMALASDKLSVQKLSAFKNLVIQVSIYIISIASVWAFWFKDENFHTELAMSEAVDRYDWNGTLEIFRKAAGSHTDSDAKAYASRTKEISGASSSQEISDIVDKYSGRFFEPTRTMVLYRDLALLKLNRALDEAFTYKDGGRLQKSRKQIPMAFQSGKQFYMQYGLVNMAYRWCLEDIIEHNWSFSTLKYLTLHCNIMQESDFAYKYINKLEKTIFYRKWARQQMSISHDSTLMATSEPYKSILPYMCFENRMSNDNVKTEAFIINHFLDKEPPHPSAEYDRAALLFAMRIQDIPRFWERLLYYVDSNDFKTLPHAVQEAALLYSTLENKKTNLPYDKSVIENYERFDSFVKNNPVRNIKESAYPYSQKFGSTFYYFYYFTRNLQTY